MKDVAVVRTFAPIALLLAFLMVLPAARADQANQATKVTFNQAVQIPGRVLPAGTYWFTLPRMTPSACKQPSAVRSLSRSVRRRSPKRS